MKVKKIISSFFCLALLLQTSCITKAIWGDKHYDERIEQFFIGADGRYVALIGNNYHYVLTDNSGILKQIFSLKQRGILTIDPKLTHLKLQPNNDIDGDIVIEGPFSLLPQEDIFTLTSLGIRPNKHDTLIIKVRLSGKRYLPKYLGNNNATTLGSGVTLPIYYKESNFIKGVGKAAITPIAVTLDAVLLIGKVAIYPFSL